MWDRLLEPSSCFRKSAWYRDCNESNSGWQQNRVVSVVSFWQQRAPRDFSDKQNQKSMCHSCWTFQSEAQAELFRIENSWQALQREYISGPYCAYTGNWSVLSWRLLLDYGIWFATVQSGTWFRTCRVCHLAHIARSSKFQDYWCICQKKVDNFFWQLSKCGGLCVVITVMQDEYKIQAIHGSANFDDEGCLFHTQVLMSRMRFSSNTDRLPWQRKGVIQFLDYQYAALFSLWCRPPSPLSALTFTLNVWLWPRAWSGCLCIHMAGCVRTVCKLLQHLAFADLTRNLKLKSSESTRNCTAFGTSRARAVSLTICMDIPGRDLQPEGQWASSVSQGSRAQLSSFRPKIRHRRPTYSKGRKCRPHQDSCSLQSVSQLTTQRQQGLLHFRWWPC